MAIERVRGNGVTVVFDGDKCIHSRNCVLSRPDVFVPNVAGEWIHPERASPAEIAELAHRCPSGAIQYQSDGAFPPEAAPRVNVVQVRENGPLAVTATMTIGGVTHGYRATLCRCGASQRQPFCDGSHTSVAFVASGEPKLLESEPVSPRDGALSVEPTTDGPLHLKGSVEIVTGTGHTVTRTTETWLCRCGQSQNKPFCDGSHKRVGFRSG
jgi:CDGSH-type Zn-finger protein/uncharacterized Fe-S cluster protein YjdI